MTDRRLADALAGVARLLQHDAPLCPVCVDRGLWRVEHDPPACNLLSQRLRVALPDPPDHCPGCGRQTRVSRIRWTKQGPGWDDDATLNVAGMS